MSSHPSYLWGPIRARPGMTASILPITHAAEVFEHLARWLFNVCTTTQPQTAWPHTDGSETQLQRAVSRRTVATIAHVGSVHRPRHPHLLSVPACWDERPVGQPSIGVIRMLAMALINGPGDEKSLAAGTTRLIDIGNRPRPLLSLQDQQTSKTDRARCINASSSGLTCVCSYRLDGWVPALGLTCLLCPEPSTWHWVRAYRPSRVSEGFRTARCPCVGNAQTKGYTRLFSHEFAERGLAER